MLKSKQKIYMKIKEGKRNPRRQRGSIWRGRGRRPVPTLSSSSGRRPPSQLTPATRHLGLRLGIWLVTWCSLFTTCSHRLFCLSPLLVLVCFHKRTIVFWLNWLYAFSQGCGCVPLPPSTAASIDYIQHTSSRNLCFRV